MKLSVDGSNIVGFPGVRIRQRLPENMPRTRVRYPRPEPGLFGRAAIPLPRERVEQWYHWNWDSLTPEQQIAWSCLSYRKEAGLTRSESSLCGFVGSRNPKRNRISAKTYAKLDKIFAKVRPFISNLPNAG